jgi:P4 family phage/plasmid primase-like protien
VGVSEAGTGDRLGRGAQWYARNGWKILPCYGIVDGKCTCGGSHLEPKDVGKHPRLNEWQRLATDDVATVQQWWTEHPAGNIGVFCRPSGFFVIDVDPRSGGDEAYLTFEKIVEGNLPPTVEARTGEYAARGRTVRGRHMFYKVDPSEQLVGNLGKDLKGIDIKHNGYVLINPSNHGSGMTYDWVPGHAPWEIEMAQAPEELLAVLRKRSRSGGSGGSGGSRSSAGGSWDSVLDGLEWNGEKVDLEKMMDEGIDEGARAVDIYKMTCALANRLGVKTDLQKTAVETFMMRFNYEKVRPPLEMDGPGGLMGHVRRAIEFVAANPKTELLWPGIGDFLEGPGRDWADQATEEAKRSTVSPPAPLPGTIATEDEPKGKDEYYRLPGTVGGKVEKNLEDVDSIADAATMGNIDIPRDPDALYEIDGGEPGKRTLTDTGNGRRLIDSFGSAVRYTAGLGWFHWSQGYWKPDAESLEIQELAKRVSPIIASEVLQYEDPDQQANVVKWATQSKSNARLKSMVENSNSDPRILVGVDNWDADENLLGVANGVIDLRTGELLRGRPDLYITKRAPVAYSPGMTNVMWQQFLDFATDGDKEFQDWLQRAAGYSLTGSRKYDVMFLVYGPPGSGKNTLVEALVKCMGTQQYAWPLDSSILAQGDGSASSTDLYHWAELRGRRMVWVDELPDSERLKENSVKKLTGSSEISARSPGEKPFTFSSRAKLWVTTNHRPIINDDAMWRRIRPIPLVKVPESPNPDLKEYIFDPEGALPAVLSWAVEGAIKMLASGNRDALGWCSKVSDAAEIYRKNEDRIGIFLSEETNEAEGASVPIKSLYAMYRMWSEERGEKSMTQIAFTRKMSDRGMNVEGTGSRAILHGHSLAPRPVPESGVDWDLAARRARIV